MTQSVCQGTSCRQIAATRVCQRAYARYMGHAVDFKGYSHTSAAAAAYRTTPSPANCLLFPCAQVSVSSCAPEPAPPTSLWLRPVMPSHTYFLPLNELHPSLWLHLTQPLPCPCALLNRAQADQDLALSASWAMLFKERAAALRDDTQRASDQARGSSGRWLRQSIPLGEPHPVHPTLQILLCQPP